MVNLHFSLLPRWRGAAPVERAILAGDTVTGVCLMAVEVGLDTGGVYRRQMVQRPSAESESAPELTDRLATVGAHLLVSCSGRGPGLRPAPGGQPTCTYCGQDPAGRPLPGLVEDRPSNSDRTVRLGRGLDDPWRGRSACSSCQGGGRTFGIPPRAPGSLTGAIRRHGRGGPAPAFRPARSPRVPCSATDWLAAAHLGGRVTLTLRGVRYAGASASRPASGPRRQPFR